MENTLQIPLLTVFEDFPTQIPLIRRILHALREDPRISLLSLSKKIDAPYSTVQRLHQVIRDRIRFTLIFEETAESIALRSRTLKEAPHSSEARSQAGASLGAEHSRNLPAKKQTKNKKVSVFNY